MAFGPDGQTFASGSDDGVVRLWRSDDGRILTRLPPHASWVYGCAFSSRGHLASCSQDQTVRIYAGAPLKRAHEARHAAWVYAVAFSPDGGRLAAAAADYVVKVFSVDAAGRAAPLYDLQKHEGIVYSVAFAPGGLLASGSVDGTVVLWQAPPRSIGGAPG